MDDSNSTISDFGGNICPKCGKPYIYVGDPIGNIEDLVCTCPNEIPETFVGKYSSYGYPINKGWICPKCGRVFAPSVTECPYCNTPPYQNDYWGNPLGTNGIRITW